MTQQDHSNVVTGYVGSHGFTQLLFWSAFYYLLPALSAQIALETHWPVLHISTTYTLAGTVRQKELETERAVS